MLHFILSAHAVTLLRIQATAVIRAVFSESKAKITSRKMPAENVYSRNIPLCPLKIGEFKIGTQ